MKTIYLLLFFSIPSFAAGTLVCDGQLVSDPPSNATTQTHIEVHPVGPISSQIDVVPEGGLQVHGVAENSGLGVYRMPVSGGVFKLHLEIVKGTQYHVEFIQEFGDRRGHAEGMFTCVVK